MKHNSNRFFFWLSAGAFLLFAAVGQAKSVPPVGQLLNAHGSIVLKRNQRVVQSNAQTGELLREGDIIEVGTGAKTQVLLSAGGCYALAAGNSVKVEKKSLKLIHGGTLKPPKYLGGSLAKSALQGPPTGTAVRGKSDSPSFPRAVPTDTPTLQWDAATTGALRLYLKDCETSEPVGKEAAIPDGQNTYTVPTNLLKPGVCYAWTVTETKSGMSSQTCAQGMVRVSIPTDTALTKRMEQEAEKARKADRNDSSPDFLLVEGYANLGWLKRAREVCEDALKRFPNDDSLTALLDRVNRSSE